MVLDTKVQDRVDRVWDKVDTEQDRVDKEWDIEEQRLLATFARPGVLCHPPPSCIRLWSRPIWITLRWQCHPNYLLSTLGQKDEKF